MENPTPENKPTQTSTSVYKQKNKYKIFFWIIISLIAVFLGFYIYNDTQEKKKAELEKFEQAKYEASRQKFVSDSLAVVSKNKAEYNKQVTIIKQRDSAFATLRYRIGDIVYLKPDSTKGVVQDIVSDSLMFNFYYYILTRNENGNSPTYYVKEKLVY